MPTLIPTQNLLPRAWYQASVAEFLEAAPDAVLGRLQGKASFDVSLDQGRAWPEEIRALRTALRGISGTILLEFTVPRVGGRADAILLSGAAVFVIEFKSAAEPTKGGLRQVWDYALDLKNFHRASHSLPIVPVLVTPGSMQNPSPQLVFDSDGVARPVSVGTADLNYLLVDCGRAISGRPVEPDHWLSSPYHPTPTVVEAARALYASHRVEEIAYSEAGGENLRVTTERLVAIARESHSRGRKAICFVTGVPGAGKTLVGLGLATRRDTDEGSNAVFLSGNDPLVKVLNAALARDAKGRAPRIRTKYQNGGTRPFIQTIRHFRDEGIHNPGPPHEHVVIYDEAQRAWDRVQLASFMKRRRGVSGFTQSEPESFIGYMDRHADWAVIVCLVGGGQEIHRGEAGISNWLDTAGDQFPGWDIYAPEALEGSEYQARDALCRLAVRPRFYADQRLHLAVNVRSFRAEHVSLFVRALLDSDRVTARETLAQFQSRYPVALTRNLDAAKTWVRDHARGNERFGMLATSKAMRLRPHAVDVRVEIDPVKWFLNDRSDVRSSFYLEDAATEFQVQGLELDWACVAWDGDLRHNGSGWSHHDFRGSKWVNVHQEMAQAYVRNAYRVLLTRARQGMAIFVPPGATADDTRRPDFYDATFAYLQSLGLKVVA